MDRQTPFNEDETRAGRSLEPWLNEPAALTESLRRGSRRFAEDLDGTQAASALMRTERLGAAVLDRHGRLLHANPLFEQTVGAAGLDQDLLARVLADGQSRTSFVSEGSDTAGRAAAIYGAAASARHWLLPGAAGKAAEAPEAAVVILAVGAMSASEALAEACGVFGLTDLQTRVVLGLVRNGGMRGAALEAGVSYETAREAVAEAMRRVGVARQTALIERLVRTTFGVWPAGEAGAAVLTDVWGLTARQATLAVRLAEGLTRAQAAAAAGLSEATAKKALDQVFMVLGVGSAAGLARTVAEARTLDLLTQATGGEAQADDERLEPLGILLRPDGSQIAYSDHGPRSGRPVLLLHSSSASRPAPSRLVAALQARGFRPLTLDRPGFGLSDPHPDRARYLADPFAAAVADVLTLLDRLKIVRVDLLARGGAQVAVALARQAPERIGRVLLVNPDPATDSHQRRRGPVGAMQEAYFRHPDLIEGLVRLIVTSLSAGQAQRIMMKAVEGSPIDVAAMADPVNAADYARGFRLFSTGRVAGYVAEQRAITRWAAAPLPGAGHWRVLLGRHDWLHDPERTEAVWRAILPEAGFDWVEDGARLLVLSHPERVAEAMAEAAAADQPA